MAGPGIAPVSSARFDGTRWNGHKFTLVHNDHGRFLTFQDGDNQETRVGFTRYTNGEVAITPSRARPVFLSPEQRLQLVAYLTDDNVWYPERGTD